MAAPPWTFTKTARCRVNSGRLVMVELCSVPDVDDPSVLRASRASPYSGCGKSRRGCRRRRIDAALLDGSCTRFLPPVGGSRAVGVADACMPFAIENPARGIPCPRQAWPLPGCGGYAASSGLRPRFSIRPASGLSPSPPRLSRCAAGSLFGRWEASSVGQPDCRLPVCRFGRRRRFLDLRVPCA